MEVVRLRLEKIIAAAPGVMVCAATGDDDDVTVILKRHRPHLMIAEPFQHCQDGIIWIKDLACAFPQMKDSGCIFKRGNDLCRARLARRCFRLLVEKWFGR